MRYLSPQKPIFLCPCPEATLHIKPDISDRIGRRIGAYEIARSFAVQKTCCPPKRRHAGSHDVATIKLVLCRDQICGKKSVKEPEDLRRHNAASLKQNDSTNCTERK